MALEIKSGSSSDIATVDADKQLAVKLNADASKAGYAVMATRNDEGTFTGASSNINPECNDDYAVRVAVEKWDFQETFAGTALNSSRWQAPVTTFTLTVAGSYARLNAGASAAANGVARLTSYRTFNVAQQFPIYVNIPLQISAASIGIANTTWEIGLFIATGTAAPTDGVFLRMNASGALRLVTSFGGSETESADITWTNEINTGIPFLETNADRQLTLEITAHTVKLWADDVLISTVEQPPGTPSFSQSQSLPLSVRIYNGAVAPASATTLLIGPITVSTGGMANGQTYADSIALSGGGAYQGESGATIGQSANWTNSTEPVNATLSNTTPAYTTLGGQWAMAAPAGAVTDYAIFGFLVPAAAASSHNKNLVVRSVRIDAVNVGAAVASTATVLQWGIAVGCTAASLATAEAVAAKAPRRVPLGIQSFLVGEAIGARVEAIKMDFTDAPLVAEPGTYVHIICRVTVGTATASQVIRGTCTINAQYI